MPDSTSSWGCAATPSTWLLPPAGAEWLPSSSPMPRPPGSGSPANLRAGDVVLVKGSRGVHLERAIEVLKNNAAETQ